MYLFINLAEFAAVLGLTFLFLTLGFNKAFCDRNRLRAACPAYREPRRSIVEKQEIIAGNGAYGGLRQ